MNLLKKYTARMRGDIQRYATSISKQSSRPYLTAGVILIPIFFLALVHAADLHLMKEYRALQSVAVFDRNGEVLTLLPNARGAYGLYADTASPRAAELLVEKEDRFFYAHPGFNPVSIARATVQYLLGNNVGGASTIEQQLAKNILGHIRSRSLENKLEELFFAYCLDLFHSKDEILLMYANTAYMGNQVQGLANASKLYFGIPLSQLDDTKLMVLLATLSSPSTQNPWGDASVGAAKVLAERLDVPFYQDLAKTVRGVHAYHPPQNFELSSMHVSCVNSCTTTLDLDLTNRLRTILKQHIDKNGDAGVRNGAIVVIKLPENELLAEVGTPDVAGMESGQQINMALQPRPIGSTAKPFIYLEGFTKGLRPYTLVDDREYKFAIGNGFPLYPKNYDGQYRGWITLHSALSNSLNVPTVKTLQYIGLPDFYYFLEHMLGFIPLQDLDTYQYGIALGALEMDPLTLAHFLTVFPNQGILKPLTLYRAGALATIQTPMSNTVVQKKIAEPQFTQLVTKILNDRSTGVEQFGLASSLNLSQQNYAVKTGTSQDYHDSWTVGFTPDFLVVVWLGNAENIPLKHVTGQSGAGALWHDTMQLLMNSTYNKKTLLALDKTNDVLVNGNLDFALPEDIVSEHRNLLKDSGLITSPQDDDTILLENDTRIPLRAAQTVSWNSDGNILGYGTSAVFSPKRAGDYTIQAIADDGSRQSLRLHVVTQ